MAGSNKPKEGYREFPCKKDDKSSILLSVRFPGKKELEAADLEYSGVFNQSLLHRLPTQAKMLRELRENEVISPKDEQEIGQLAEDLRAVDAQIRKLPEVPADALPEQKTAADNLRQPLMAERARLSKRLSTLNREIEAMLAHTADNKASEAQRNFLIACVVEFAAGDNKGERVWDDVDALLAEKDSTLLNRVLYEYMMCQQGLPSDWDNIIKDEEPLEEKKETPADKGAAAVAAAVTGATPEVPAEAVVVADGEAAVEVKIG